METDQIERLLAHDPLMCHYTVTAKDEHPKSSKPTRLLWFVIHTTPINQENIGWSCTWTRSDGQAPQHVEFANYMNEHCLRVVS